MSERRDVEFMAALYENHGLFDPDDLAYIDTLASLREALAEADA